MRSASSKPRAAAVGARGPSSCQPAGPHVRSSGGEGAVGGSAARGGARGSRGAALREGRRRRPPRWGSSWSPRRTWRSRRSPPRCPRSPAPRRSTARSPARPPRPACRQHRPDSAPRCRKGRTGRGGTGAALCRPGGPAARQHLRPHPAAGPWRAAPEGSGMSPRALRGPGPWRWSPRLRAPPLPGRTNPSASLRAPAAAPQAWTVPPPPAPAASDVPFTLWSARPDFARYPGAQLPSLQAARGSPPFSPQDAAFSPALRRRRGHPVAPGVGADGRGAARRDSAGAMAAGRLCGSREGSAGLWVSEGPAGGLGSADSSWSPAPARRCHADLFYQSNDSDPTTPPSLPELLRAELSAGLPKLRHQTDRPRSEKLLLDCKDSWGNAVVMQLMIQDTSPYLLHQLFSTDRSQMLIIFLIPKLFFLTPHSVTQISSFSLFFPP